MIDIITEVNKLDMLIVEDSDDIRDIISTTFNKICKTSRTAVDGKDGLQKFKEKQPDIILTDIRMPNMNGNEMIEAIKNINPNIPIIAISGHSKLVPATKSADIVLEKPIKFDKLLKHIYNLTR